MFKWSFLFIAALAALQFQQNEAFVTFSKSIESAPAGSAAASAPAPNPNALVQGLAGAVATKIQTVKQLVNGLVQAKTNFKQSLLQGLLGKFSAASGALGQPSYLTKTVRIPIYVKGSAPPAAPDAAAVPASVESISGAPSAGYAYRQRY